MKSGLIVLDIDDTLYLERDYVRSGFQAVSSYIKDKVGFGEFYNLAWGEFLAGRRGKTFDNVLAQLPSAIQSELSISDLVQIYRSHKPNIHLCSDASHFINASSQEYRLAVVTDGPANSQRNKIEALGLEERVSELVVTDEHGPLWPKPSHLPFRHLQESFGVSGDSCVYIADNPQKDFVGPTALGWHTIRILRPGGLHVDVPDLEDSTADIHVKDLNGLLDVILEMKGFK